MRVKYSPKNERVKREYFEWQKNAKRKSDTTIDNVRKDIGRYEKFTEFEDFRLFGKKTAIDFKKHLIGSYNSRTNRPLSKSTALSVIRNLKEFFLWLKYQKGYKRIDINEVEYFNLSEKDMRKARSKKRSKVPTIEQIIEVLSTMPTETEMDQRNKALIAFTILTGIRDSAIASLKLKHIKLEEELVEQEPNEVNTKFSKQIFTYFFPVGEEIKLIVINWVKYLKEEKLFDENDPIFPRTRLIQDDQYSFKVDGLENVHWNSANQIRKIFRDAFTNAGLDYYTPHSLRKTLVRLGERICTSPEEFKAWSQNLGHEQVLTTFYSYGNIPEYQQGQLIKGLLDRTKLNTGKDISDKIDLLLAKLDKKELD